MKGIKKWFTFIIGYGGILWIVWGILDLFPSLPFFFVFIASASIYPAIFWWWIYYQEENQPRDLVDINEID